MAVKLIFPAIDVTNREKATSTGHDPGAYPDVSVEVIKSVSYQSLSRNEPPSNIEIEAEEDDAVELNFGEGVTLLVRVDQLREQFPSLAATRDTSDPGTILIPSTIANQSTDREFTIAGTLKSLDLLRIKLKEDVADTLHNKIDKLEEKCLKSGDPSGLYWVKGFGTAEKPDGFYLESFKAADKARIDNEPYLLFLHGTFSSTTRSFGDLARSGGPPADGFGEAGKDRSSWEKLTEHYANRILAFEHPTLTKSPIDNLEDLLSFLPSSIRLHIVSHSRGGLIGDLLCLSNSNMPDIMADDTSNDQLDKWRGICKQLEEIKIERFVRVACPALGTSLLSDRGDRFLNAVLNTIGLIPAISGNAAYELFKYFLLALFKLVKDPSTLPGLAAMKPDSPLLKFLNDHKLVTNTELAVIAGDIEYGLLTRPWRILIDRFFDGENDLIVNTASMYAGIKRKNEKAYYFCDQNDDVSHFSYFSRSESNSLILKYLTRKGAAIPQEFISYKWENPPLSPIIATRGGSSGPRAGSPSGPITGSSGRNLTIDISVMNGDLRFAKYPILVGHYKEDGLFSAERYIDGRLKGRLSRLHALGSYPGDVGEAEVLLAGDKSLPKGALIIGLGNFGHVTVESAARGVMAAALRYAFVHTENQASGSSSGTEQLGISSLLVGAYGGNALSIEESIRAILLGIGRANNRLREMRQGKGPLSQRIVINKLELVELYEDVATQALRVATWMSRNSGVGYYSGNNIKVKDQLDVSDGNMYKRPADIYSLGWWRRIQISGISGDKDDVSPQPACGPFSFLETLSSREEISGLQRNLVNKWINEAVKSPTQRAVLADYLISFLQRGNVTRIPPQSLKFLVLTDRARAEVVLQPGQRELIDRLVDQAVSTTMSDIETSNTLFDLLVPNELKGQSQNVVLILDSESARYPWEMLTDRKEIDSSRSGSVEPISVRNGMLRQFKTNDFRPDPKPSYGNHILIIGDTNSEYPELPGAKNEAEAVNKLMREDFYETNPLYRNSGTSIVNNLFARDYRIIHIAAHGHYDPLDVDRSGVILGDGLFLTSKEFNNLRSIPDLVFLNCCHLGKTDGGELALMTKSPHRLAASVAEQLMKIGVKAVIAAGWAVNDEAAVTFATTFYRCMLDNCNFGDAVRIAREKTWEDHPGFNTWGAYQCYGNPDFRLRNSSGASGQADDDCYSRQEYIQKVREIAARYDPDQPQDAALLVERLRKFILALPPKQRVGEIFFEIAEAWKKFGDKRRAIYYYRKAIARDDATASLKAIEQCANLESRLALDLCLQLQHNKKQHHKSIVRLLDLADKRVEQLLSQKHMKTSERLGIKAKILKVRAEIAEKQVDRENLFTKASACYCSSYQAKGKTAMWGGYNWLACRLLASENPDNELKKEINDFCKEVDSHLNKAENPGFWDRVYKPDSLLLKSLCNNQVVRDQETLKTEYTILVEAAKDATNLGSVREQVDLIIRIFSKRKRKDQGALKVLREIVSILTPGK